MVIANQKPGYRRHSLVDTKDTDEIFTGQNLKLNKSGTNPGTNSVARLKLKMPETNHSILGRKHPDESLKELGKYHLIL